MCILLQPLVSASAQISYLSGTGKDDTVNWEFYCTGGAKSGYWTTIPVPSCWEQEGFGTLSYGREDSAMSKEQGRYRYTFTADPQWVGKQVNIVFEGSMTDTEVSINSQSAGPVHQGAFYRFKYDVTDLLHYGSDNELFVTVDKFSADTSVNEAERYADYWVFGGIYRPVYLEILPLQSIERTAIDAGADGSFTIDVYLQNLQEDAEVVCQLQTLSGEHLGDPFSAAVTAGTTRVTLSQTVSSPNLWTAETPHLYQAVVQLMSGTNEMHSITERFGFRTVEVRAGDGIYVNGKKVILKGVNRHSFHPDSARTLNEANHIEDILLIKEMNMNTVRMSHYPPDVRFLELCDELGLYVLNELAGWQASYTTAAGAPLVKEMVTRDVNHPSIIFWNNGNEDGWNTELDDDFGLWDPQGRAVLHPWSTFSNINTKHYISYSLLEDILTEQSNIFLPTEFLHGLYDGGAGAGLDDYWSLMRTQPLSAGGIIWVFSDEAVQDRFTGTLNTAGNYAPDGILGPYREKEGSFYTIKEIWSPIQLNSPDYFENTFPEGFDGSVTIQNLYNFINTSQLTFEWQLVNYATPEDDQAGHTVMVSGQAPSPDIAPGETGNVLLALPADWDTYDALFFTVRDHHSMEIWTWTWTIKKAGDFCERLVTSAGSAAGWREDQDTIFISAGGTEIGISKTSGMLTSAVENGRTVSLNNGPLLTTVIRM
jgi:hypothetical protein